MPAEDEYASDFVTTSEYTRGNVQPVSDNASGLRRKKFEQLSTEKTLVRVLRDGLLTLPYKPRETSDGQTEMVRGSGMGKRYLLSSESLCVAWVGIPWNRRKCTQTVRDRWRHTPVGTGEPKRVATLEIHRAHG